MHYKIEKADEGEIPRILELYDELGDTKQEISRETAVKAFREISTMQGGELLVIKRDDLVVGTLYLQIIPNLTHNARPWAAIENVVIDKRYHREGIGKKLMEYAVNRSREAGCHKIQLLSTNTRKQAHEFYRSLGFGETALGFRMYLE
jgi:ribosomal protein S18 acetylase RimI-like enzyme